MATASMVCATCGLPNEICVCEEIAREQQEIRIKTETRRYGKLMTIVDGVDGGSIDIGELCSKLKSACACGGTAKDGRIELQGDHRVNANRALTKMGFKVAAA
ncbi:MAG: stress response translation initiation inhibitor YciH [Thermoplasmatota archaeon]